MRKTWFLYFALISCSGVIAQSDPELEVSDKSGVHELFAAYWTNEPGWDTELQIRNDFQSGPITVTPYLRLASGHEIALPAETVKPAQVVSINVSEALSSAAPDMANTTQAWGSVAFRYTSQTLRNIYAAVVIHSLSHPIMFHMDALPEAKGFKAGSREGVWWNEQKGSVEYLILTNNGLQKLQSNLVLLDSSGNRWTMAISIGPAETQRLNVNDLLSNAGFGGAFGGIRIEQSVGTGSLDSTHVILNETTGFSALMKMFDNDPRATIEQRKWGGLDHWVIRAPMLALSHPDPALGLPQGAVLQPEILLKEYFGQQNQREYSFQLALH